LALLVLEVLGDRLTVSIGLSLEDVELANLAQEFQEEVPVLPRIGIP